MFLSSSARLDLRSISTSMEDCLSFHPGTIQPALVSELRRRDFDQAPVVDDFGQAIGVLETAVAESLAERGEILEVSNPSIMRQRLPALADMDSVLAVLSQTLGVLVVDDDSRYLGLVTVSDLNRHRFRAMLYAAFAELEALIARLIDVSYDDPWLWLDPLREDIQARLVGYWEVSKRRGVSIGPQAACTLTELLDVLAGSSAMRREVGFASRSSFEKHSGGFPDYRNRVMHPVRPLVLSRDEVSKLREMLARLQALTTRVRSALAEHGYGSRVTWL